MVSRNCFSWAWSCARLAVLDRLGSGLSVSCFSAGSGGSIGSLRLGSGIGVGDWKSRKEPEAPARLLRKQRRVSTMITSDEGFQGLLGECLDSSILTKWVLKGQKIRTTGSG